MADLSVMANQPALWGHLNSYADGVEAGNFDKDLDPNTRYDVAVHLRMARDILGMFGSTSREQLIRSVCVRGLVADATCERVAEIIRNI